MYVVTGRVQVRQPVWLDTAVLAPRTPLAEGEVYVAPGPGWVGVEALSAEAVLVQVPVRQALSWLRRLWRRVCAPGLGRFERGSRGARAQQGPSGLGSPSPP